MNKYKVLIGLEMHAEITYTNSKAFSGAMNKFSEVPNENVSLVDMAFPGMLPLINKEAVRKSLKLALILNAKTPEYLYFERKNYYYPDLPKGYQITQETKPAPIGIYGTLEYYIDDNLKTVRINNLHLEEDTANLDHYDNHTLVDYNRAGVPLLEIVTEPDFRSSKEAVAFIETMKKILQYSHISSADSKKGEVRCDVNISLMDASLDDTNPDNWGVRTEIKNVNSTANVEAAIEYEIKRQIEEKEKGIDPEQSTRRWDEALGQTVFMRSKKDAIDYKYFVEPNIPKYKISQDFIESIKKEIVVLPNERIKIYKDCYNMNDVEINSIIRDKDISDYFDKCIEIGIKPSIASNWILTQIMGYLNKNELKISSLYLTPEMLKIVIDNIDKEVISSKQAKEIFVKVLEEKNSPDMYINDNMQLSNEDELESIIKNIMDNNPGQIEEYKNGKTNLFQFFVGQVMKETKGKANPNKTSEIINKYLTK